MTNSKSTKRALLTSVLALLMCVAMLIGATFAWFTDTASTGVNKIQAGNLDVELEYKNSDTTGFTEADKNTKVFKEGALWEPGHVEYVVLKVSNAGSLALKYKLGINIANEVGSTNVYNNAFKLSNYIRFAVLDGDQSNLGRDNLVATAGNGAALNAGYTAENHLTATGTDNSQKVVTLVVWMPTTVGNEANHLTGKNAPSIDLGISVVATQDTVESDSFDDQYDKDATYPEYTVTTADALTKAAKEGGIITVNDDIAPSDTVVASGTVQLNMNGKKLANTADIWSENENKWSLVSAQNGANLTITGNGTFAAKENDCYAVDVQDGSTVTITSGTFNGNIHTVYVLEGTAIIQGGFYSVQQKYPDSAKADEFVLNCYDANRANGTAKIIVTGGTFVNFNPADCQAEGAHTNFVADGYKVVTENQTNGDVWYTVVPK